MVPVADLNDIQIHYKVHGDENAPPVLGVMGFGLDQRFWAAQIPAITQTHSFITFDNRGVGRSSGPAATTVDEMARDSVRLLDHLGIDSCVVFGVSMGGTIAQRMTLDHPERVSALVLAITWARPTEFMRRQHHLARSLVAAGGADALFEASIVRMFSPQFFEFGIEMIDRIIRSLDVENGDEVAPAAVLEAQLDAIDKHDALADLGRIQVPTLVAGGKMDQMAPYFASEEIAAKIPGARLVTFETGHGLMVEEMQAFNDALSEFLRSLK